MASLLYEGGHLRHFLKLHRPALVVRLARSQPHDHRDTAIQSIDRNRLIQRYGAHERLQFADKAFGVAVHKEIQRQVPLNR